MKSIKCTKQLNKFFEIIFSQITKKNFNWRRYTCTTFAGNTQIRIQKQISYFYVWILYDVFFFFLSLQCELVDINLCEGENIKWKLKLRWKRIFKAIIRIKYEYINIGESVRILDQTKNYLLLIIEINIRSSMWFAI